MAPILLASDSRRHIWALVIAAGATGQLKLDVMGEMGPEQKPGRAYCARW